VVCEDSEEMAFKNKPEVPYVLHARKHFPIKDIPFGLGFLQLPTEETQRLPGGVPLGCW
jgi:hypothetical protein